MNRAAILAAIKRHGDRLLAEEKARGILPAEKQLLEKMQ